MKLTKTLCGKFEPKDKPYKKFDGGGLYLEIMPNGKKLWRLKYYFQNKEKRFSLGIYPLITLSQAREKRLFARRLLDEGIDPSKAKQDLKKQAFRNAQNNFETLALEWHENQIERWSKKYARKVLSLLKRDVFPFIGDAPIANITTPDVLEILRHIEKRNALYEAGRARQLCSQVFRYAIQTGRCEKNPSLPLHGALKTRKRKHFVAIDSKEIPEFLKTLEQNDARLYMRTRRAIRLSMLTFVRPGELRQARWEDINLQDAEWIIPAEFMKSDRDHIVPLASQSLIILKEQKIETGRLNTPFVFPSQVRPRKPMSDGTVNVAIKKLGYHGRMTAHGFRALARTTIREKLNYYPDIIEAQLAHKPSGPLGAAYDRAQFLNERKKMMQDWADYLEKIHS